MKIDKAVLRASWQSWIGGGLEYVGPYWLQWVWTLLFCAALAVGFTIFGFLAYARDSEGAWHNLPGWLLWYGKNLVVCVTIGSLIHVTFDLLKPIVGGQAAVRRWKPWQRTVFFAGVPLACVAVGWPIGLWLSGMPVERWTLQAGPQASNLIVGSVLLSLLLTFVFHQFFAIKARQHEAEKQAAEAQLRLLQGQIEPHFLFNTLANVISLIDDDAPRAKQMLETFTDYLRKSLSSLRHGDATVGSEIDLAENYLGLLKTRMEDRLRYDIHSDAAARGAILPPLLLQPLVENAIHHGLEPKVEGGQVRVSARVQGGQLVLEVADDGLGLNTGNRPRRRGGAGMALSNLRERLLAKYGNAASLTLADGQPGTVATLRLPLETRA